MKEKMQRFVAIILLFVPGFIATYGFLLVKDALFAPFDNGGAMPWGKLVAGCLLFAVGVAFIGGWIFFRDRKRNYVAPRFRQKRNRG